MTLDDYQKLALETAVYPNKGNNFVYPAIGLAGEAGEVSNKIKKILRDDGGVVTDVKGDAIAAELGDCLWYIATLASEIGVNLSFIAKTNIAKLSKRHMRGTIGGSGDNR